jgi:hypothetical protein
MSAQTITRIVAVAVVAGFAALTPALSIGNSQGSRRASMSRARGTESSATGVDRAVDHTTSRMISPRTIAARKKKANVTSADRRAILDALPRNDQFRLYSPYAMTKAHAAASAPNTSPRTALSSRFTIASVAASSGYRAASVTWL